MTISAQHVGAVKDYNVDVENIGNTTVIRQHTTAIVDSDERLADLFQKEAELLKQTLTSGESQEHEEFIFENEQISPSEQRINLERYYTPIIKSLTAKHIEACDAVEEFESDQLRFRAKVQAEYAFQLKHPDVKTLHVAGDFHFNTLLSGGHLEIPGYRMVDRRSNGGAIQVINDSLAPAQGSFTLVFIPIGVPSLMSYSNSPEALVASQQEYDHQLQLLIKKRKAAAIKLTEIKQSARDALAAIPSFDDLIRDSVKRALKK